MARFKTEIQLPSTRRLSAPGGSMSLQQEKQVNSWNDMEVRMEKRHKEWDDEVNNMRSEFFKLKPTERLGSFSDSSDGIKTMITNEPNGGQKFKVQFDVSDFKPEEIQVRIQDSKLSVAARHEEKSTGTSVSKEYSRQLDIPSNVDQEKLQCVLGREGVLCIEGPIKQQLALNGETILPIQQSPNSSQVNTVSIPNTNGVMNSTNHNQIAISRPLEVATAVKNPIITEPDGTRKLRLSVDVGEFKPEEIVVKTDKNKLIVHAEHEEKLSGKTMHKEFNKEYELPESVDQTSISAYIGEEGKLYIEAPLKPQQQKRYSITQSHDVKKVVVTKESQVTITDSQNRPMITINVHRR